MSRTVPAARAAVHVICLLHVLLLLVGCGGGDPVEVRGLASSRPEADLVEPEVLLDMLCTGESSAVKVRHRYEVTVSRDGSITAFCQAGDENRQVSHARTYDGPVDAIAAWAECTVELPVSVEGAQSTTWRYRSHVDLNKAGTVYGDVEPGERLSCYRLPR